MLLTFAILFATIALFMSGKFRADGVAVMSMLALLLAGLVTVPEALAGFSSGPVMMIAALFVIGGGLTATGVTHWLGHQLLALAGSSETRLLVLVMVGTGVLSGFMSNTGVVAMLLPAVIAATLGIGMPAARVLMPMAYAANLGGLLTMIGTPPNLIVNAELAREGLEPLGFFSFALMGVPLLGLCILYMVTIGRRQLGGDAAAAQDKSPGSRLQGLINTYELENRFYEITVKPGAPCIGGTAEDIGLLSRFGIVTLLHRRAGDIRPQMEDPFESPALTLQAGDRLLVKSGRPAIDRLVSERAFGFQQVSMDFVLRQRVLFSKKIGLMQVLIPPRSDLIGKRAESGKLNRENRLQVLAIRRRGTIMHASESPGEMVEIGEGDMALVRASWSTIRATAQGQQPMILLGDPRGLATENIQLDRHSFIAVGILAGMVLLMLSGAVPAVTCTLLAAAAMVLTGCMTMEDGYREINWQSVVLIAAMFPMATAIEHSGGAQWLADGVMALTGGLPPVFVLAGIFILTSLLSQVISNTASTILLVPIVIATAHGMEVSVYPLLMGVAVAASTSLMTPIGTVPNLLVMTPGNYSFSDYVRCGLPLTLLLFAATLLLVPLIWPF